MFGVKLYLFSGVALLPLSIVAGSAFCGQLSASTEVQGNINILQQTKSCPQCDLSGADLNRMDLSSANLEGANLSRAKLNLANLTGANLRQADLRDVGFGGADLADADLRGADLRGTSFAGAYMNGVLLDGEMVTTMSYVQEQISNVEETIYVEDTVEAKNVSKAEELIDGSRRDFEEIPTVLPIANDDVLTEKRVASSDTPEKQEVVEKNFVSGELETATEVSQDVAIKVTEEEGREEPMQNSIDPTLEQKTMFSVNSEVLDNVELLLETNQCYGCNLEGADLSGKNLEESDLEGANLRGANLKGADLEGANLKGANLSAVDLQNADLDGADLYKADLSGADLTDASLDKALLDDAILNGVKGYQQGTPLMLEE